MVVVEDFQLFLAGKEIKGSKSMIKPPPFPIQGIDICIGRDNSPFEEGRGKIQVEGNCSVQLGLLSNHHPLIYIL